MKFVTRFPLGLSLSRGHQFKHSFQDSTNTLRSCSLDVESTIDYFFHTALFKIERHTRLNVISQIGNKFLDNNESNLIQGNFFRDTYTNTEILNATVNYVSRLRDLINRSFKNVMFDRMLRLRNPYGLLYRDLLL